MKIPKAHKTWGIAAPPLVNSNKQKKVFSKGTRNLFFSYSFITLHAVLWLTSSTRLRISGEQGLPTCWVTRVWSRVQHAWTPRKCSVNFSSLWRREGGKTRKSEVVGASQTMRQLPVILLGVSYPISLSPYSHP